MSTETLTIIGTIIAVGVGLFAWLRSDIHALRDQMATLNTEVEGLLEGLRESISGRGAAAQGK